MPHHGLFPNTGHHFFFLPFSKDTEEEWPEAKVHPEVLTACLSNLDEWTHCTDLEQNPMRYLLWRLGSQGQLAGIHIAFDTNIGDCSRGNLLRGDLETVAARPYSKGEFMSMYFAENIHDEVLRAENNEGLQQIYEVAFTNQMLMDKIGYTPKADASGYESPPGIPPPITPPGLPALPTLPPALPSFRKKQNIDKDEIVQCFAFWWPRVMANEQNEWGVDLIVDFGNSRSVALLLERPPLAVGADMPQLGDLLSPVRMLPRGESYRPNRNQEGAIAKHKKDPLAVFDSWFVTREPQFAHLQPPCRHEADCMPDPQVEGVQKKVGMFKKELVQEVTGVRLRVPHLFMEMAPCSLGQDANRLLAKLRPEQGGTMFLSSPKRYAWDTDPLVGMEWCMVPNRGFNKDQSPRLRAHVLAYLPENYDHGRSTEDSDWAIDDPPPLWPSGFTPLMSPEHPSYPRADSMTWVALAIIEQAYRQMCSEEFRRTNEAYMIRRLRSIVVTYPPGWSGDELRVYKKKWNTAINIFALSHLADPIAERPELDMSYDESISAQLPIVYSEIQRMGNDGDSWLRLIGRQEPNQMPRARVMTIDVGGGTTDYSVYEYNDLLPGAGVELDCALLFKDSSNTAGDQLVEALISEMLLPKIAATRGFLNDPEKKKQFERLFNSPGRSRDEKEQWRKIVRLVLVPQINHWLTSYVNSGGGGQPDTGVNPEVISAEALELLNAEWKKIAGREATLLEIGDLISYSYNEIEALIHRIFQPLCDILAKLVEGFDVDMVILSGKTSELPGLQSLLWQCLPLLPCRIVSVKNYPIGEWYPYLEDNRIYDAKTVTATGVALSRAMAVSDKLIPGWAPMRVHPAESLLRENCWVRVSGPGEPFLTNNIYLDNGTFGDRQTESEWCPMLIGTRIGRTLLPTLSNVEPVYRLRWRSVEDEMRFAARSVQVRFRRVLPTSPMDSESLELIDLIDQRNEITIDMVELQLCTLMDSSFWMDRATFPVNW